MFVTSNPLCQSSLYQFSLGECSMNQDPLAARESITSLVSSSQSNTHLYLVLAGVPVGGKLSVCLIWNCMKYRIIILIIIIKRLGEILLSYMANTSHTHARTHPVSMYFPSQDFMILLVLVDDVVSSRRPITPEIHLLSLTIFTQEALVTLICMNLSVSYPNWYELKWYACANYLWVKNRICGQRCSRNGSCLHLA